MTELETLLAEIQARANAATKPPKESMRACLNIARTDVPRLLEIVRVLREAVENSAGFDCATGKPTCVCDTCISREALRRADDIAKGNK